MRLAGGGGGQSRTQLKYRRWDLIQMFLILLNQLTYRRCR